MNDNLKAKIIDIQRMSTEDGPGLRTTVFFKGCNLNCAWCHNPESINPTPHLNWYAVKCMGCGICVKTCPQQVISKDKDGINFKRDKCIACGKCVDACPQGAIELKGHYITVDELCKEVIKDRAYFGLKGGITFSGGEPMLQSEIILELAKKLKANKINSVAVDTAGLYDFTILEKILPYIDIVLFDLKIDDNEDMKKWTNVDNTLIKENYKKLIASKTRVWVRTPIIPGATDSKQNIEQIAKFIKDNGYPERWELCSFNNLATDKYERLDKKWQFANKQLLTKEIMESLTSIAKQYVPMTKWTGATKIEE